MKKLFLLGMIGAIALTFNACSSDDELANEKVDQKEVKTRFALSLTNSVNTRMAAGVAQEDGRFNGIKDIMLFPAIGAISGTTALELQKIPLADFDAFDAVNANGKVYTDVSIPVGVDHFLFYGRSKLSGNGELKIGYLVNPLNTGDTPEGKLNFELVPWTENLNINTLADLAATTEAQAVITALNAIYAALKADGLNTTCALMAELTAGNTNSIGYFISDLVDVLTRGGEYSNAIRTVVETYFTISGDNNTGYTATWKGAAFPVGYNLPDGAVVVAFDATNEEFSYVQGNVAGLNQPAPGNYVRPAELLYWVNTTAMTSTRAEYSDGHWGSLDWPGVQNLYTRGAVQLSTKSVIMEDQVQYGVGRLDAQVRIKPNVFIMDSGSGIAGAADENPQQVTVPAEGYKMTGILIGGQKNVGWDFTPNGTTEYTIWDSDITATSGIYAKQQDAYSDFNYTLALETIKDTPINIAIEFENNTDNDFHGVGHQIIPAHSKFYLVAQLDPTHATNYDATTLNKVFMQDHNTIIKMTIDEDALKSAYNVVPDLRSQQLEFGLSVNLEWQQGLIFEQDF